MKLKTILLSGLFLIPFFSCENREEVTITDIKTVLIAEITVIAEPGGAIELKSQSGEEVFSFTGTGIFCLAQNNELGKPMCIFQNIKPEQGCKLVFSGFEGDGNILSMQLRWDSKSNDETDFDMQNEIDLTSLPATQLNGNLEIDLTNIIDPLVNCIDCYPNCMYRIDIVGTADFSPPSIVVLKIPITAESRVYPTKFSLF